MCIVRDPAVSSVPGRNPPVVAGASSHLSCRPSVGKVPSCRLVASSGHPAESGLPRAGVRVTSRYPRLDVVETFRYGAKEWALGLASGTTGTARLRWPGAPRGRGLDCLTAVSVAARMGLWFGRRSPHGWAWPNNAREGHGHPPHSVSSFRSRSRRSMARITVTVLPATRYRTRKSPTRRRYRGGR